MRYPELAGDRREGVSSVEGLHQNGAVRGGQAPEGARNELPVEDLPRYRERIMKVTPDEIQRVAK